VILCLASTGQTLKQIGVIDLTGPKGQRFDYLTMDDEDHYLLSAHLGPGILYVIDVKTNKLVEAIAGVPMKLQMKREALAKLNRQANERGSWFWHRQAKLKGF
jgi:hypothetical protein